MKKIRVGVVQAHLPGPREVNISKIDHLVTQAAKAGAQIVLTPELFEGPYFCNVEQDEFFAWAHPVEGHPLIQHFQKIAQQLQVVLPISFFEKEGPCYFNSVAILDADGKMLGTYRKSHIPDCPGYEEKYYFRPGDTGFRVFSTRYAKIGVAICWDQWFPECARAMTLQGAEILLYPTTIGSEPAYPEMDTKDMWQRAMMGHAVCNIIPVAAANRTLQEGGQTYYGHSFLCDYRGNKVAELDRNQEGYCLAEFDLEEIEMMRASFGFFRDRREELYHKLCNNSK